MPTVLTDPLAISRCKAGDDLVFFVAENPTYDPKLTIYDMDDTVLHGPVLPDATRDSVHYWFIEASATFGMGTTLKYYHVKVDDDTPVGYVPTRWLIFVSDEQSIEQSLDRALGLSGYNQRKYNHVWTRGLLTSFEVKLYDTASDLDDAEAGTSDNFTAHYLVNLRYTDTYNLFEITSKKQ